MIYLKSERALFRSKSKFNRIEIYRGGEWVPYTFDDDVRSNGVEISATEAEEMAQMIDRRETAFHAKQKARKANPID